jgi:hypothetical protein
MKEHMKSNDTNVLIGKFVIVRSNGAGVLAGTLEARRGDEVVLKNAYRIWQWGGANTLTELALRGASMEQTTRISEPLTGLQLVLHVLEVLETSADAQRNLSTPRWL